MRSKSIVFCFLVILIVIFLRESQGLQQDGRGVCVVKVSTTASRRVIYTVSLRGCRTRRCYRRRAKIVKFPIFTNRTICCHGWTHDSELDICKPICSLGCLGGQCVAPATCQCDAPLYLDPNRNNICLAPVCHPPCVNSICYQNNKCECANNTRRYNETHCAACDKNYTINADLSCSPICHTPCINGVCEAPDRCRCLEGYVREHAFMCKPQCETCVNSFCVSPNKCACRPAYTAVNDTHCVPKCDNCEDGECVRPNVCICREGYRLVDSGCEPVCSKLCVNGECSAPDKCTCYEEYERSGDVAHPEVCCRPECNGTCGPDGECSSVACWPRCV